MIHRDEINLPSPFYIYICCLFLSTLFAESADSVSSGWRVWDYTVWMLIGGKAHPLSTWAEESRNMQSCSLNRQAPCLSPSKLPPWNKFSAAVISWGLVRRTSQKWLCWWQGERSSRKTWHLELWSEISKHFRYMRLGQISWMGLTTALTFKHFFSVFESFLHFPV